MSHHFSGSGRRAASAVVLAAVLAFTGSGAPSITPSATEATAAVLATSRLTSRVNDSWLRNGETFWLSGTLSVSGASAGGRTIRIQQRTPGTRAWTTVGTTTTNRSGWFQLRMRPKAVRDFRALFAGTSTVGASSSPVRRVSFTPAPRTNAGRVESMGSHIGSPRTPLRRVTRVVSFRDFTKGRLVTVSNSRTRTWWVSGRILSIYKNRGGPQGSLGVPTQDARCGLVWGGCVQGFSKGVVYANARGDAAVSNLTGRRGEAIAAARSQVGYQIRYSGGPNRSKYNTWIGTTNPWCSFVISWAFAASGNRSLVPQSGSYGGYERGVRAMMPTGSKPRVGALAIVSYVDSRAPSHTQFVVDWSPTQIKVIHGNTGGNGLFGPGVRGVAEQWVPRSSRILYYGYPRY